MLINSSGLGVDDEYAGFADRIRDLQDVEEPVEAAVYAGREWCVLPKALSNYMLTFGSARTNCGSGGRVDAFERGIRRYVQCSRPLCTATDASIL